VRGPVSLVLAHLPIPRGEFTMVLGGAPKHHPNIEPLSSSHGLLETFCQMTESGDTSRRAAINQLAERHGMTSREIYAAIEKAKKSVK
jgi:hypothetical protein